MSIHREISINLDEVVTSFTREHPRRFKLIDLLDDDAYCPENKSEDDWSYPGFLIYDTFLFFVFWNRKLKKNLSRFSLHPPLNCESEGTMKDLKESCSEEIESK